MREVCEHNQLTSDFCYQCFHESTMQDAGKEPANIGFATTAKEAGEFKPEVQQMEVCHIDDCEFGLHNKVEKQMDGQVLKSGEKKDEGKPRWELLDYTAIEGIVKILTLGAKKYEARNWELGLAYGRVFGAVLRHLSAWWMGNSIDSETGLSHLDHALTELMFLSAYEKRGMKDFDDRPKK